MIIFNMAPTGTSVVQDHHTSDFGLQASRFLGYSGYLPPPLIVQSALNSLTIWRSHNEGNLAPCLRQPCAGKIAHDKSRRMSQEQLTAALVILALRGLSKSEEPWASLFFSGV